MKTTIIICGMILGLGFTACTEDEIISDDGNHTADSTVVEDVLPDTTTTVEVDVEVQSDSNDVAEVDEVSSE